MFCPNCGNQMNGNSFCIRCGTNINSQDNNITNHELGKNEELIKIYVGKNYSKLSTKSFSWCYWLIGDIYLLYRKTYSLFFKVILLKYGIWIILSIIINVLLNLNFSFIQNLYLFMLNLGIAIKFKYYYLDHVNKKVDIIKKSNTGKTFEELKNICRKKGGTNIVAPIALIFITALLFALYFLFMLNIFGIILNKSVSILNEDYLIKSTNEIIKDINENEKLASFKSDKTSSLNLPDSIVDVGDFNNGSITTTTKLSQITNFTIPDVIDIDIKDAQVTNGCVKYDDFIIKIENGIASSDENYKTCPR